MQDPARGLHVVERTQTGTAQEKNWIDFDLQIGAQPWQEAQRGFHWILFLLYTLRDRLFRSSSALLAEKGRDKVPD